MSLSTRVLDTRVSEWSRKKPRGEIGVEVELEGVLDNGGLGSKYWIVKPEGSLRDGCEYVLASPARLEDLDDVGREFDGMMKKSKPKKTIRCSTHIHVNVNNKKLREVYNIIGYYYLIEELLVRTQGPARTGNLFCLRMSDAENIGEQLLFSTEDSHITVFSQNQNKYGALNLAAPMKFGSLEFRFLLPMTSWKEISIWIHLLHRLVNTAKDISIGDSVKYVLEDTPRDFLRRVFTKEQTDFILGHFGTTLAKELLLENFDYIEELSKSLTKTPFFKLPKGHIPSDINYMGMKKPSITGAAVPGTWGTIDEIVNPPLVLNWNTLVHQGPMQFTNPAPTAQEVADSLLDDDTPVEFDEQEPEDSSW